MYRSRFNNNNFKKKNWCGCEDEEHRNLTSEWYEKEYSLTDVEEMKQKRLDKNQLFNYNNLEKFIQTRWIGDAGEDTFMDYLNELYGIGGYTYFPTANRTDDLDFQIGRLKVDVKCIGTEFEPKNYYNASVNKQQYDRIIEKGIVNALVFVRYIVPENRCLLVGFVPLHRFQEKMKFVAKGDKLNSKAISNTDMYSMRIECLYPMIEIDRHK
jgi:hypothetical protein